MAMGPHQSVSSTNLQSVAYDPDERLLEVKFANGSVYQYAGVPASEAQGIVNAASPGSYLSSRIKGMYSHSRIA